MSFLVNLCISNSHDPKENPDGRSVAGELPQGRFKLEAGTIVNLVPEPTNAGDKNAIQVFLDGKPIGYVANKPATVPKGCSSATDILSRVNNPAVKETRAILVKPRRERTSTEGINQERWIAEVFFQPYWEKEASRGGTEATTLRVSGSRVMHGNKATAILRIKEGTVQAGDMVAKLIQSVGGAQRVAVYLTADMAAPAGEIAEPPEALLLALQTNASIPVTPIRVVGNEGYDVSLTLETMAIEDFIPDMEELVANCILQVRDVKERVSYMVSQAVPPAIIKGVLHKMQRPPVGQQVRKPVQLYLQTAENDFLTRALGYHLAGKNIRLVGEKGCGKNTLIYSVCWVMNQPLVRVQGNEDTDKMDLLGSMALDSNGTKFQLSSFIKMLMDGGDVVLDEINSVGPGVALALHSLADDARSIDIPGYGFVQVHPRAHIWATMNEDYVGTGAMNPATADRFVPMILTDEIDIGKVLKDRFPEANDGDITICKTVYNKIRQAVRDGKCSSEAITTRGYIDALEAAAWLPLRKVLLDNIACRPQDNDDRQVIIDFINAVVA